ncbi:hypothetical protein [Paenibacillus illinoisensis]|uniref:hypothetical protein n=1 Tax=Paenibacillus illinoisensis TaxID=59845 RepID=UPI00301AFF71
MDTMNYQGTLFSILSNEVRIEPWLFSNFIQLRYVLDWELYCYDNHDIVVETCPFIKKYTVPRELVNSKWEFFSEFIKDCINNDIYIWCHLDRFYIPSQSDYQKKSHFHETLIYGYDDNKIFIADNLANGKYSTADCKYHEIEDAYNSVKSEYDFVTRIIMLKKKVEDNYVLNIDQVKDGLQRLLYSKPSFDPINCNVSSIYGLDVYKHMLSRFEHHKHKINKIDIRPFHLFWEHKKVMNLRLKYMVGKGLISDQHSSVEGYVDLENKLMILRNLVLKYNLTLNKELLDKIESEVRYVLTRERICLEDLLRTLI